jgi:predicted nucleotidyltransferase
MNLILDDEWTTVVLKNKKYKSYNSYNNKTLEEINKIVFDTLIKYKPYGIFIYGSRARKTNRSDSDIDLMIFWKKLLPTDESIKNIKNKLFNNIKLNIDMVNMFITNKCNKFNNDTDKCYYNNVINDAISIYQFTPNNISDLIDISIKLDKI